MMEEGVEEKRRNGRRAKNKGRACSSTCSISAIGTSSSGSLFCLSTYFMEMTVPELLKEVDIYAASDCRFEFNSDRGRQGGQERQRRDTARREKRWANSGKEICL